MAIKVAAQHLKQIREHGEATYPHECCGLLLGHMVAGEKQVTETYAAQNTREEDAKHNRFLILPDAVREAEQYARRHKLEIVGFYHSHPNAPASPSQFDLDHAWPFYSYVIVSVRDQRSGDLTCWQMRDDRSRFDPEAMVGIEDSG